MIITILLFALAIVVTIIFFVALKDDFFDDFPTIFLLIAVILTPAIIGAFLGIANHVDFEIDRANALDERAAIVYRLEQQTNDEGAAGNISINGGVYEDALKFNDRVRRQNKWGTNPWTNWFCGWAYVGLEEIEIMGEKR